MEGRWREGEGLVARLGVEGLEPRPHPPQSRKSRAPTCLLTQRSDTRQKWCDTANGSISKYRPFPHFQCTDDFQDLMNCSPHAFQKNQIFKCTDNFQK